MQRPLRFAARLMTASTYVLLGADALREPGGRVGTAESTLATLRQVVPLPADDELLVRVNAAAQILGGITLASGKAPKLSALVLIGSLVPTTVAGHAFWKIDDPMARKQQRTQFIKNTTMVGGLLFSLLDQLRPADHSATVHTSA